MKKLLSLQGGYPRQQDYLLTLQSEFVELGNSILGSISFDVILSGCEVTNNNDGTVSIAQGMVYINGQVLRFDAAANINADGSKIIGIGNPVTSGPKLFFDTGTKNVYSEVKGVVADKAIDNNRQLIIRTTMLTLEGYIDARIASAAIKGTIREFVFETDPEIEAFLSKFDDTGLGISPDMIDWQLMNGNNGPNATGAVSIGVGTYTDPNTGEEITVNSGDIGGEWSHIMTAAESAKPPGLPPGLEGPHRKPGDGGGSNIYYVNGPLGAGSNATAAHNIMQKWLGVFKVRKFR